MLYHMTLFILFLTSCSLIPLMLLIIFLIILCQTQPDVQQKNVSGKHLETLLEQGEGSILLVGGESGGYFYKKA